MGKSYSKQEEKEIIIAQSGQNNASTQESEQHKNTQINTILLGIILAAVAVGVLYLLWRRYRSNQQKWIQRQINVEFLRRMVSRLSARRAAAGGTMFTGGAEADIGLQNV